MPCTKSFLLRCIQIFAAMSTQYTSRFCGLCRSGCSERHERHASSWSRTGSRVKQPHLTSGRESCRLGISRLTSCGRKGTSPVAQPIEMAPSARIADSRARQSGSCRQHADVGPQQPCALRSLQAATHALGTTPARRRCPEGPVLLHLPVCCCVITWKLGSQVGT